MSYHDILFPAADSTVIRHGDQTTVGTFRIIKRYVGFDSYRCPATFEDIEITFTDGRTASAYRKIIDGHDHAFVLCRKGL